MAVRKTTVWSSAVRFLQGQGKSINVVNSRINVELSTKIRLHILSYLENFIQDEVRFKNEIFRILNTSLVISHRCGCGNCDSSRQTSMACTCSEHLNLIPQSDNLKQISLHDLLDVSNDSETQYNYVLNVVQKIDYAKNIF